MPNFNCCTLAGHVVRDPELKQIGTDKTVGNFTLAVNRGYGEKQRVAFVDCVAWGKTAEAVGRFLKKGSPAMVRAEIDQENWEDKEGKKRSKLKMVVQELILLGTKGEATADRQTTPSSAARVEDTSFDPFNME